MSDKIKGLTIVLEPNIRDDDAEVIINAIKMIRGVAGVEAHVADLDHYMAVAQVRTQIGMDLLDSIREIVFDKKKD